MGDWSLLGAAVWRAVEPRRAARSCEGRGHHLQLQQAQEEDEPLPGPRVDVQGRDPDVHARRFQRERRSQWCGAQGGGRCPPRNARPLQDQEVRATVALYRRAVEHPTLTGVALVCGTGGCALVWCCRYVLAAMVVAGSDLPKFNSTTHIGKLRQLAVSVSIGSHTVTTQRANNVDGVCTWNHFLLDEEVLLGDLPSEIPDVFVYLVLGKVCSGRAWT